MNNLLNNAGFTLIECLIILALIAILASIAMLSGGSWFNQQHSHTVIDQLVHELQFARQQAILRKTLVTFCPTEDFQQCADNVAWKKGYLIFIDPAGKATTDANSEVLNITRLTSTGLLTNTRDYIQFTADGFTRSTNSTFTYTADNKEYRIIINLQGRIRVEE
jgi:type IV fimbrial biogenesis protein FimT